MKEIDDSIDSTCPEHLAITASTEFSDGDEIWLALVGGNSCTVLDLGAGVGRIAVALARTGHVVTAIEANPSLASYLARNATDTKLRVVKARFGELSLSVTFDVIIVASPLASTLVSEDSWNELWGCVKRHMNQASRAFVETFDSEAVRAHDGFRWPEQKLDVHSVRLTILPQFADSIQLMDLQLTYTLPGRDPSFTRFSALDLSTTAPFAPF